MIESVTESQPESFVARGRRWWRAFRRPVSPEKRRLLAQRRGELAEELRVPWQVVGKQLTQCGYTLGPSYCSFGCTHCYLPTNANRAPLPTFEEMKEQIDANRRLLGHAGNLQITGGDVVDAYLRAGKPDELVRVVRYAVDVGLVPMLMTHGQKLLEDPLLLDRLVVEGKLRKLAIHIDVTQAGRPGFPIRQVERESDLHPLRRRFVELILGSRERTGVRFAAAHTLTITERNVNQVDEVLQWLTSDPRHLQAFRMVSLQPEARVGRTRMGSAQGVEPERCWGEVESFIGAPAGRDNLWFGDPSCSRMTTLLVLYPECRLVDAIPSEPRTQELWGRILDIYGGVGGRGADHWDANWRRLALTLNNPSILWRVGSYVRHRARQERLSPWRLLVLALRGRVGALNVVQHNFMDQSEVLSDDPRVRRRLDACSFRGAVRRGGEWHAVPMCAVNSGERQDLYDEQISEGDDIRF